MGGSSGRVGWGFQVWVVPACLWELEVLLLRGLLGGWAWEGHGQLCCRLCEQSVTPAVLTPGCPRACQHLWDLLR